MVEVVLDKGDPKEWKDNLTLRGGIRDGKLTIPDATSVRLKAGELAFTADAVKGEFGWRKPDRTQNQGPADVVIHPYAVEAKIAGGAIAGTWKSADGKRSGSVSGWIKTEKELQTANAFTKGKDWAFYHGSLSSFAAAPCGLTLVNDPKDFRLVWKSEELMPNGQGNGTGYLPGFLMCRTIGGGASPVVSADGKVYVFYMQPSGTFIEDAGNGLQALEKMAAEWNTEVGPGVREKFLRDADDVIVCMDAVTGKTLWKTVFAEKGRFRQGHKLGPVNNTPCLGDGKVFAMGSLGRVYALDAQTGKPLWEVPNITGITPPGSFYKPQGNSPVYVDGVVVTGNQGDTLHGFDAKTGKELWKLPGKNNCRAVPSLWTHQGKSYILSPADKIYCIEPKSGKVVWETDYKGGSKGVAVSGDILVGLTFSVKAPECVAWRMTPEKAERIWATTVIAHPELSAPAVNDKYVVVGKHAEKATAMQLLDLKTGKVLADAEGPAPINEGHIFMAENLVFVSVDGSHGRNTFGVYGATPETFKLLGSWSPPHHQTTSYHDKPMTFPVVEGRLFMRGFDGIHCYDLRTSPGQAKVEQAIRDAGADANAVITRLLTLATDADVQVREFAGRELAARVAAGQANSRQAEVLPVLIRLMTGTDPQLRRQLALALGRLGEAALSALVESSRQPDITARILVMEALGQMNNVDDPRIDQILLAALEDTNMNLLEAALTCLGKRTAKLELYQPVLIKLIDATHGPANWSVDRQAMVALLKILPKNTLPQPRPKKLEPLLVDLLAEFQDTATAYRAVEAIRALGDEEALRIFIGVLENDIALRGIRVANGLGEMGARAKPALPALERAMVKWKGSRSFMNCAQPAVKKIQEAK